MSHPYILRRVGELMKIFPAFVFIFYFSLRADAIEETHIPDFAFPQTVIEQSDSLLSQAIKQKDDPVALRSAMNIILAKDLLTDSENISADLTMLDSLSLSLKPIYSRLASLIQAEILYQAYSNDRSKFDMRSLPMSEPFPSDPAEWSGDMYKNKILQLIDSASNHTLQLPKISIKNIKSLVTDSEGAEKIGLTSNEFIIFKCISILKNISGPYSLSIIPFYPQEIAGQTETRCHTWAINLSEALIEKAHGSGTIVEAMAMKEKLGLIDDAKCEDYLKDCIKILADKEGCGLLLYEYHRRYGRDNYLCYNEIRKWLNLYPKGYYSDQLEYALAEMNQEKIDVNFPSISLPKTPIKGEVSVSNLNKGYLLVFKLDKGQYDNYDHLILKKFSGMGVPVKTIELNQSGTIPFHTTKQVEIPGLTSGLYVVIPSASPRLPRKWKENVRNTPYSTIRVSDIAIITTYDSNTEKSGRVYVVKGKDQQPVAGATVYYYGNGASKIRGRRITNSEGFVIIPEGYYRLEARYGFDFARTEAGFSYYPEFERKVRNISILTDLEVYRPGDTVGFAVIGWYNSTQGNSLIKNNRVEVLLKDAGYSQAGSTSLILDDNGRAHGQIVVPKGKLLGNYQLIAQFTEFPGVIAGMTNVLVEEYHTPPFQVTLTRQSSTTSDSIFFTGKVNTFSGMPVSDAKVNLKVEYIPRPWGIYGSNANFFDNTVSDNQGEFFISLPVENLKGTPFEKGRFSLTAEVTSEAGETQSSAPLFFYLGNTKEIRPSIPDKVKAECDSIKFFVPVYDMAGMPVKTLVNYRIKDLTTLSEQTGEFISPCLMLSNSALPSGRYSIKFTCEGDTVGTSTETIIWREHDSHAPYPTSLWIPSAEYSFTDNDDFVEVTFGSFWDDWILCIVSDGKTTLSSQWITPRDTLSRLKVEIPSDSSTLFVNLCGMHYFSAEAGQIKIIPRSSLKKMNISSGSFRENITAGDKEVWSFKIKVDEEKSPYARAFAVMTDKALNSIRDFQWNLNIYQPSIYSKIRLTPQRFGNAYSSAIFSQLKYPQFKNQILIPSWETYGYPFVSGGGLRIEGPILYRSAAVKNAMTDFSAGKVMEEQKLESADDAEGEIEVPAAPSGLSQNEEQQELRPVEMPLAFFMPDLTANENGEINVDFVVPDFNTTWQFQLAAYNKDLLNANILLDAVSSKPVMVKSNLPSYLLTGDKAEISATIFNNSDTINEISGKIEILDPATGTILASRQYDPLPIEPSGNRMVNIRFDVPDNLVEVAVRVYGFDSTHSDGEQGFVCVRPSSIPVIEASTFYAGASQETIEIKIPKLNKGSNVTLKYCDNPLWEVVLSLPAVTTNTNPGSLSVARWLYGTLVSSDIINNNFEIASGLMQILSSEDTTLTRSNLQKEAYLKITSLEATPWVNNAEAETARIRDLGKYFDRESIDGQVNLKMEALKKLQLADGGWCWFEGMKSSPYITMEIIKLLGYLKQKDLLTSELNNMARKAVRYYDEWLADLKAKGKSPALNSVVDYLYARNLLGYNLTGSIKDITYTVLDSISKEWKHMNPGEKAKAGLLLSDYEQYKDEATLIGTSLQQFTSKRLDITQQALMLELFEKLQAVSDTSEASEAIRQAMFLKKETEDWGSDHNTPSVVYVLLKTLPTGAYTRELPKILMGDQELVLPAGMALTGNYTINLDPKELSGKKLTITRSAGLPAWGGVISQYIAPVKDVKSHKVDNLSVEKRIYKKDDKGKLREVAQYSKGDEITVVINIDCRKDMDYVVLSDIRSACLVPDDFLSQNVYIDGMSGYREIRTDKTSFFIENLTAGKHIISYDCHASRDGEYSLGIASIQCLYSPAQVAHSAGRSIKVDP